MFRIRRRGGLAAAALRLTVAALGAGLAACDSGTAPSPPPPPPPPPAVHDLAFTARVRGIDELWRLPLAGGTPQPLLAGTVNAWHPAPSPDGRRLAFVDLRDEEVWIAPVGGAPAVNLSRYAADIDVWPAWSPDGTRLAFSSARGGALDVHVVNADGSGLRNLTPDPLPATAVDEAPAWSPDGTRIAFASDRGGSGHRAIWTVRPDGSDLQRLSTAANARDYDPAWSPDGRRIVFRRVTDEGSAIRTDLAILTLATGAVVELPHPGTERAPSWSPDGALIAFTSEHTGESRLYTMRPDGSDVVERAGGPAFGRHVVHPAWILRRE